MQTQWYGDKRDVVKWATLVHLCAMQEIKRIIQLPFLNDAEFQHKLRIDERDCDFPGTVWNHFRDLKHIERLGEQSRLEILVISEQFRPRHRDAYIEAACRTLDKNASSRNVLFLDPDTGVAKKATARHVTEEEITYLWGRLKTGDWLVLYQHASRKTNWRTEKKRQFSVACAGAKVLTYDCQAVAHDVVFFCAGK